MKDIDFDELDRAVSSVLGQKTPDDTATAMDSTAQDKPESHRSSSDTSGDSVIESGKTVDTSEQSPSQTTPKVPLAIKRRGKFMDMVHPSAAMTTKSNTTRPLSPHAAPVVQPLDLKLEPDMSEAKTEDAEPLTIESTVEHKAEPTAAVDESQSLIGAEPAPLEDGSHTLPETTSDSSAETPPATEPSNAALSGEDNEKDVLPPEVEKTDATEDSEVVAGTTSLASTVPQTTPFLTDTKVEKRPLGGFVEGDVAETANSDDSTETEDNQNPPVVPLPRELQPDVMEVESDQVTASAESAATQPDSPAFATSVEAAPEPGEDGRVEGHPLFDTSTYHEPIAPVTRKSMPAWLKWLLGLLVCLVIGAGVGYFLFTAGL